MQNINRTGQNIVGGKYFDLVPAGTFTTSQIGYLPLNPFTPESMIRVNCIKGSLSMNITKSKMGAVSISIKGTVSKLSAEKDQQIINILNGKQLVLFHDNNNNVWMLGNGEQAGRIVFNKKSGVRPFKRNEYNISFKLTQRFMPPTYLGDLVEPTYSLNRGYQNYSGAKFIDIIPADLLEKSQPNLMADPSKWARLEFIQESLNLVETEKTAGGKSFWEINVSGIIGKIEASKQYILNELESRRWCILFHSLNGNPILIGDLNRGAVCEIKATSGAFPFTRNEYQLTFSLKLGSPSIPYDGEVVLPPSGVAPKLLWENGVPAVWEDSQNILLA